MLAQQALERWRWDDFGSCCGWTPWRGGEHIKKEDVTTYVIEFRWLLNMKWLSNLFLNHYSGLLATCLLIVISSSFTSLSALLLTVLHTPYKHSSFHLFISTEEGSERAATPFFFPHSQMHFNAFKYAFLCSDWRLITFEVDRRCMHVCLCLKRWALILFVLRFNRRCEWLPETPRGLLALCLRYRRKHVCFRTS